MPYLSPPRFFAATRALALLALTTLGCTSSVPETAAPLTQYDPDSLQLVEDLARPWGLKADRVDGVSMIVGLAGTGSDPPPSAERDSLLTEMRTRDVDQPNQVLASNATSLSLVTGYIPPGARKGDHFDILVSVPRKSETTSLQGGWLMLARLREYAMVKNRVASGKVLAHAQGDVIVEALAEGSEDPMMLVRGRILGGGVVLDDRRVGMAIRDGYRSVKTSMRIGEAVNRRFHVYHNGKKQGVAVPKDDNFVELLIHPAYRDNLVRYMRVVRNVPVRETPIQRAARLRSLRDRMFDAPSAAMSAVQLEAIGSEAIPILEEAMQSENPEVQFYAAEALAYLNHRDAAGTLGDLVLHEPAFRWRALTALGAIEDLNAQEELVDLLQADSAETRYGAFRVLRKISPDDPAIDGRVVGDRFHLHKVRSDAPPLIHLSKKERPEVVLFGHEHRIKTPCVIFAGNDIVVRGNDDNVLTVSRLTSGDHDQRFRTDADVEGMLAGIVEVGGSYADVVHAINEARRAGCLTSRVAISAIPELNRTYRREQHDAILADGDRSQQPVTDHERASRPSASDEQTAADLSATVDRLLAPTDSITGADQPDNTANLPSDDEMSDGL